MVNRSHSSVRIFAVLALSVALSGCGGGDDDGGGPAATPTATTAPVATETVQVQATSTATVRPTVTRTEAPPPSATATVERTPTETVAPSETPLAATPTATRTATQVPTTTGTSAPTTPPTLPATATLTPTATPTNPVLENPVDETISAVGLPAGTAYVAVDSLGMPHIYGDDQPSILFVQGYQTAKERFWQMDAFRRVAEGRLSELFGTLTFDMDVEMRTIFTTRDGRRIEQALWERLQADAPEQAVLAQAYTNGINAWLADLRAGRNGATLPAEYTLVGFTGDDLDDWRPQDSLAIGRLQAYSLSSSLGEEIEAAEIEAALPEALRLDIFRSAPGAPATVLPVAALEERTAESSIAPQAPQPPLALLRSVREMLGRIDESNPFGSRTDDVGSNNWIVAPSLSANGHAMLANDPHLQLFNPAIWHMVQLDAGPGFRATGVNFPGLPGIILGHNDFGAWGGTVAVFDVTDVYVEEVTTPPDYPNSPRTVTFNGAQVDVLRIVEQIGISGGSAAAVVIEVVPHHGPMVPDPNLEDGVEGLAATNMSVRWTGHEVTLDSLFLTKLNQARNVEEFKDAVRNFAVGAQNWVWADIHGDIAYFPYVLVPQRPAGTVPYLPLDGRGSAEWLTDGAGNTLWLPEEKFPQATNPPEGFLATANNDQIGNTLDNDPLNDEIYLTFSADIGFREQRIQDLLSNRAEVRPEGAKITREDMSTYQYDTVSLEASRLLPFLFAAADARPDLITEGMQEALDRLRDWGETEPGSPAWVMASGVDPADSRDDVPPRTQPVTEQERVDAVAASIFAGWSTRLSRAVFIDDFAGTGIGAPGDDFATKGLLHILEDIDRVDANFVVHTKGSNGESTLWDNKNTASVVETRDEVLLGALRDALPFLTTIFATGEQDDWQWGKVHNVRFQHFFGQAGLPNFDLGNFSAPGGRFTVNPAGYSLNANSAGSFVFSSGPSKRFVAVLDPAGIESVSILPGGNNGNPGPLTTPVYNHINPAIHYGDHIPGWINGDVFAYRVSRDAVAADTQELIQFVPAPTE